MPDLQPLPEDWVYMTHPDGSGEVASQPREAFDAIWVHKGWVLVESDDGRKLTGGEHVAIDPLLQTEPDEVQERARHAARNVTVEPTLDDLRDEARRVGVPVSGTKDEVAKRIDEAAKSGGNT